MNTQDNDQPLRLAFIGGGINSAIGRVHFIASQMDRKFEVIGGLFSRDLSVQKSTENYFKINKPLTFQNLDDLINKKNEFDALVLLTPTPTHFEFLKRIIQEEISIICEKAFVANIDESKLVL
jgi:predicted dehydrogenase